MVFDLGAYRSLSDEDKLLFDAELVAETAYNQLRCREQLERLEGPWTYFYGELQKLTEIHDRAAAELGTLHRPCLICKLSRPNSN